MGIFSRCQLSLDLDSSLPFKKKIGLKKAIIDHGGTVSFIVTKKTTHLVVNSPEKARDSYKSRMAQKWGIPVVSMSFIDKCVEEGKLLESDTLWWLGRQLQSSSVQARLSGRCRTRLTLTRREGDKKSSVNLNQIRVWVWPHADSGAPSFPEDDYEIPRFSLLKRFDERLQLTSFACLEIHVGAIKGAGQGAESEGSEAGEDRVYRLFSHQGTLEKMDGGGGGGKKECRYLTSALDVEATYSQLYQSFVSSPHSLTPSPLTLLPPSLGSPLLQKHMCEVRSASTHLSLSPHVARLVDYIWSEAVDQLETVLAVSVATVTQEQLDKAEAALLSIRRELDGDKSNLASLSDDFYSALPHKRGQGSGGRRSRGVIDTKRAVAQKQDLCQT
ncbi:Protein mono-ADP-ribosyltransferase PARP4 [Geodia barretti]|uniref:Protein mono-ADP-ribosyltransferase PARP4 n=1 Tax=Geodia barretti TaxID=519541 RepID=A0AA35T4I0_GEOBA|nr:Protein mono-ADP-ribosyltransferase PARP4 [Geodia barretti]